MAAPNNDKHPVKLTVFQEQAWYQVLLICLVYLISFVLLFVAAIFAFSLDWNSSDGISLAQIIAVILTGGIVIWYTWETRKLAVEARRQTQFQLRPFVLVRPTKDHFEVTIIGNGPAINIKLGDVEVDKAEEVSIRFPDQIPALSKGEAALIRAESFRRGKPAGDFFLAHLDPNYANRALRLTIRFQDVEFRLYSTSEVVVPGKLEIGDLSVSRLAIRRG